MTRRLSLLLIALFLVPLTVVAVQAKEPRTADNGSARWDGSSYVAHEWGTFVAVQGADGTVLDGLTHHSTDLPDFVHDLRDRTALTGISPKMETPVIYFYAPKEQRVAARVDFPRGTITQWYPAARAANHTRGNADPKKARKQPLDTHKDGYIVWGDYGDLLVMAPDAKVELPPVSEDDPWRFSRQVDANLLRVCTTGLTETGRNRREISHEHERLLFYRGLGSFPLPLQAQVQGASVTEEGVLFDLTLENTKPDETLQHVLLLHVEDGQAAWLTLPELRRRKQIHTTRQRVPLDEALPRLKRELVHALVAQGLYTKEALAMVNTWQKAWLAQDGLRVLSLLPTAFVDRELPLQIDSVRAPKDRAPIWDVKRVFVGRLELLTPQDEHLIHKMVAWLAEDIDGPTLAQVAAGRWGRFALPYLKRVRTLTTRERLQEKIDGAVAHLIQQG